MLAGNLLMNAASWRVVRGQTYCVHCRGSGKEACPSCVGSGIKEPEKVRMNQIRHAGERGSGEWAGAWGGHVCAEAGAGAVLSMPCLAGLFAFTVRSVSANKRAIQTSVVPTHHRVLADCQCLCGPCVWPGVQQPRGGGLLRTECCGFKRATFVHAHALRAELAHGLLTCSSKCAAGKLQQMIGVSDAKMHDADWMKSNRCVGLRSSMHVLEFWLCGVACG